MGLAMSGATAEDAGLASGLVNTTGQVGGALGLAVLATRDLGPDQSPAGGRPPAAAALTGGYHLGFWISAGLVLLGVLIALTVLPAPAAGDSDPVDLAPDADVSLDAGVGSR